MKKAVISLLFAFALSAISTNMVFAGNPIPGINIVCRECGRTGADIIGQTGNDGKVSIRLKEGASSLTISYVKIMKKINSLNKNKTSKGGYTITLTLESDNAGLIVNGKPPGKLIITKDTGDIGFVVPKEGATLKLTLTYDIGKSNGGR